MFVPGARTNSSPAPARVRAVLALVLGVVLGLSAFAAVPSLGDEIGDTRTEAQRIADRIEELGHEAEVLTERYLDAKLARARLDDQITEATTRARRSRRRLVSIRSRMRSAAVQSYMSGSADAAVSSVVSATDPNEIGRRRGYADSVTHDTDDLIDEYRGIEADARGDARDLAALRREARRVEQTIESSREATERKLADLREVERQVTGRLRRLVEAEQRRRIEARERAAARRAARAPAPAPPLPEDADESSEDGTGDPDAPTPPPPESAPPPEAPGPPSPPRPPSPPSPPTSSTGAAAAIEAARSVLGVPYRWAGASPSSGFDCSGLTMWAWSHGGKSLPHSSRAQYAMARKIPVSELAPGDLVFYNSPVSHVGLYIGGGMMIHAPHTGDVVKVSSIYYWSALTGGGRI